MKKTTHVLVATMLWLATLEVANECCDITNQCIDYTTHLYFAMYNSVHEDRWTNTRS
jgi:hypothetical protein